MFNLIKINSLIRQLNEVKKASQSGGVKKENLCHQPIGGGGKKG